MGTSIRRFASFMGMVLLVLRKGERGRDHRRNRVASCGGARVETAYRVNHACQLLKVASCPMLLTGLVTTISNFRAQKPGPSGRWRMALKRFSRRPSPGSFSDVLSKQNGTCGAWRFSPLSSTRAGNLTCVFAIIRTKQAAVQSWCPQPREPLGKHEKASS